MEQPKRIVIEIEPRPAFVGRAAGWIARAIAAAVRERGRCAIALAGGNTPRAIYAHLARHETEVPWGHVEVFFGDERAVPPDDPASNFHMADEALLRHVPVPRERVHRMEGERADLDAAARAYEALLPDQLDVVLLGIGPDGHTASLFPGAPSLDERVRRVLAVPSPFPPPRRLTITPPVIAAAHQVAVFAAGADKAPVVERVLEGPFDPHALPVQLARAAGSTWLLDRDAAAHLEQVPA
jgi:6-phosphogluconolactonase